MFDKLQKAVKEKMSRDGSNFNISCSGGPDANGNYGTFAVVCDAGDVDELTDGDVLHVELIEGSQAGPPAVKRHKVS